MGAIGNDDGEKFRREMQRQVSEEYPEVPKVEHLEDAEQCRLTSIGRRLGLRLRQPSWHVTIGERYIGTICQTQWMPDGGAP